MISVAAILAFAGPVFAGIDLPDGKGKDIVESACTRCHTLERIVRQSMTAEQWRNTLREMVENGASLDPEEWDPVVAYLAKNFGPDTKARPAKVNVNKDTAKEISAGLRLTPSEADAIVAYRTANGAFRDVKDLEKVPGLDPKKIGDSKDRIVF
ncbi:MAG: helix-hairpin-helix domain-containing protein [Bryobacteraceae bacterium]